MNLDENEKQRLFDLVCDDFLSQEGNLEALKELIEGEEGPGAFINLENILKDRLKRKGVYVDEILKDELLDGLSDGELLDLS
jgi:hypothetical protein